MKHLLLLITVFISVTCSAQKIERSETDKFTGQKRTETNNVAFYGGTIGPEEIQATLRGVDNDYFFILTGYIIAINIMDKYKGIGCIVKDEKLIFLLDDNSTITATSVMNQNYHLVSSAQNISKLYTYQYRIAKEDIAKLAAHTLKSVRVYYEGTYKDWDLKDKNATKLKNLFTVFSTEINKS